METGIPRRAVLATMLGAVALPQLATAQEKPEGPAKKTEGLLKILHAQDDLLGPDFDKKEVFPKDSVPYLQSHNSLIDEDFVTLAKKFQVIIREASKLLSQLKDHTKEVIMRLNKDFLPKDEQLKDDQDGFAGAWVFLMFRIRDYSTRLAILQRLANDGRTEVSNKFFKP